MAKLLLVISALIALSVASENVFFSEKYVPLPEASPFNLFNGSYFPKLDHFRPQDNRTVQLVSQIFREKCFFTNISNLKALSLEP